MAQLEWRAGRFEEQRPQSFHREMSPRFSALRWLDDFLQGARYVLRGMRKRPSYAVIAALTLALGIGANTAVFSLVEGVLLRPLAYPAPEMLVFVTGTYPNGAFAAMRQQLRTTDVAAYADGHSFNVMGL